MFAGYPSQLILRFASVWYCTSGEAKRPQAQPKLPENTRHGQLLSYDRSEQLRPACFCRGLIYNRLSNSWNILEVLSDGWGGMESWRNLVPIWVDKVDTMKYMTHCVLQPEVKVSRCPQQGSKVWLTLFHFPSTCPSTSGDLGGLLVQNKCCFEDCAWLLRLAVPSAVEEKGVRQRKVSKCHVARNGPPFMAII